MILKNNMLALDNTGLGDLCPNLLQRGCLLVENVYKVNFFKTAAQVHKGKICIKNLVF